MTDLMLDPARHQDVALVFEPLLPLLHVQNISIWGVMIMAH